MIGADFDTNIIEKFSKFSECMMENKVSKLPYKRLRHAASTPFILGMVVPIVFLDACMEAYHQVAFPLYGLPKNKRENYIRIDHQKLSYLKPMDKVWCMYCGYANGLFAYAVKVAGDTEKYWCGVKHKQYNGDDFVPQPHQEGFLEYDDEEAYREFVGQK